MTIFGPLHEGRWLAVKVNVHPIMRIISWRASFLVVVVSASKTYFDSVHFYVIDFLFLESENVL